MDFLPAAAIRKPVLFQAKLVSPPMHHPPFHRERLYQLLKSGTGRALTTVVAPYGCGKTALLSLWAKQRELPVGWFSVDEGDRSLNVFMEYVIRAMPGWPESVRNRLSGLLWAEPEPSRPRAPELSGPSELPEASRAAVIVSELIAVLQQFTEDTTLIIDGYERIDNPTIDKALSDLIAYAPPHLHLIVSGLSEPPFAGHMVADWDYVRIDARQLALTASELTTYFARSSKLHLTELDVRDILERTDGWITGVNAILSLVRHTRVYERGRAAFYERLDDCVAGLFDAQVMAPLSAEEREWLMRLAVPERFDPDLARHLLDGEDALPAVAASVGSMLRPVQREQGGYELQPMLRSFLRNRLRQTPELYKVLHHRCISWLEKRGRYVEAATCAQWIEDDHTVARIISSHPEQLLRDGNLPLLHLLDRYPEEKWPSVPVLAWMYASVLIHARNLLKAEQILDVIDSVIRDREEPIRLPSTGEDLRAYLYSARSRIHMSRNEPELGIQYTLKTKDLLGGPGKLHGILHFSPYTTSILNSPYGFWGMLRSSKYLADYVLPRWGRLDAGYCAMLVLDGECRLEAGSCEEALPQLNKGLQLALELREPGLVAPALIALARLNWCGGRKESAYAILQEGREHMVRMNARERIHLLDLCELDFRIREAHMKPVRRWLANQALAPAVALEPNRSMEAILMLRALFALGRTSQARSFGQRLLRMAESNGLPHRMVEIRLILAQNDCLHGNLHAALENIDGALQTGIEQGYERLFTQEGGSVARLLHTRLQQLKGKRNKPMADYLRRLLQASPEPSDPAASAASDLLAYLSRQETRVCQHIMEGKSNAIIAQSLGISLETVKKHCQNMYSKLGVGNRREMIALLKGEQA